jgi:hypothetical protein
MFEKGQYRRSDAGESVVGVVDGNVMLDWIVNTL